jgi:hydrocephalus-inducing protein
LPQDEGGNGEASPFILDPEVMTLDINSTQNLTVYAFPDQAKLFKDEIICLIKDNPNPVIFNIQCLGAQPVVAVDQEIVEFDRLILGSKLTKKLGLKNTCAIPIQWNLQGCEELPEEFKVSKTSGVLKPCKEEQIDIDFESKTEKQFEPFIKLQVQDTEGYNIT